MKKFLSLDVGGTNTKYGILDEKGEILFKDKFPTEKNKEAFLDSIKNLAEKFKKSDDIQGIAMSMPGIIDTKRGYLVTAGALVELYKFELKAELEKSIGLPVSVENDVNCVALAEKWLGHGKNDENFICLAIGTGIGGAIIINNKLYRGHRYLAGEFGFMVNRGNEGLTTLSMTSSTQNGLVDVYRSRANVEKISGEEVFAKYEAGDEIAKKVFKDFYESLSAGIFNLIFSLDPSKVLIGGAISENKTVMKELVEHVLEVKETDKGIAHIELPKIEPCKFKNDAGIIGALYNFLTYENS